MQTPGYGLGRRAMLAATVMAPLVIATRAAGFNWQRHKGDRVEVFLQKSPRADLLRAAYPEFEALTGIKVLSE